MPGLGAEDLADDDADHGQGEPGAQPADEREQHRRAASPCRTRPAGRAPNARATVTRCGSTWRIPASTASVIGKKPSRNPKAIFDAASSPKNSISDGYQTTAGTA